MNALTFSNPYKEFGYLSNLYPSPMIIDGEVWLSVEHYYQAQKVADRSEQIMIKMLTSPILARKAGRKVKLRPDWEKVKDDIMYRALSVKFTQNPGFNGLLFSTENHFITFYDPNDEY